MTSNISGNIRFTMGDQTFDAMPGDSWTIPGNMQHSAEIIQNSVAVEIFSPLREDYLPEQ